MGEAVGLLPVKYRVMVTFVAATLMVAAFLH